MEKPRLKEGESLAIYILTSEDPLYSHRIIQGLFDEYDAAIKGVAFVSGLFSWKRLIVSPFIYGFVRFGILCSKIAIGMLSGGGKIEKLCKLRGRKVEHFDSVADGTLFRRLQELNINLIVSVNCNKRLKKDVISQPKLGVLNIHNALLPAYRGLMPIVHALINEEKFSGITVHFIDSRLDTGPIILQERLNIAPTDDLFSIWERSVDIGARLLPEAIRLVSEGRAQTRPNGPEGASYHSFPSAKQILKYKFIICRRSIRSLLIRTKMNS